MTLKATLIFASSIVVSACFNSCGPPPVPVKNEVILQEIADPEMLNPLNSIDATTGYITSYMYQRLVDVDFHTAEFVPVLAESRPLIEKTADGKMTLTFTVRKEAKWDNENPITAKDIEFSIKTLIHPLVNNPHAKPYFTFISDFVFYPDNDRKFTVVANEPYYLAESAFTDVIILPEYMYDPKGILRAFTIKDIHDNGEKLKEDKAMREFADDFNSEKRMRDPNAVSGSGPYRFSQWITNERVILTKKEGWWGDVLEKENCYFEAYPEKLIFQTIKDQTAAINSLKAGNVDLMKGIRMKDFMELPNSEKFAKNFNTHTPMEYSYVYIGLNLKSPYLSDKLTRQALAHIVNVDEMIQNIKYGKATRIVSPVHPSKKHYNKNIIPYNYDLAKAKQLLEESGWKNTNGDETLDKVINGKRQEFVVDFLVNNGNDERKSIALLFQEEAKKVGIKVNVLLLDWAVFLEKCAGHQFDLIVGKWVSGPSPDDMKQNFHSSSTTNGGSNFSNFTNAAADALMDSIRVEIDENKRMGMYMKIQEILHDELPMIYLYAPTERIAISKKFDNAYPSVVRPGYWPCGFKIRKEGAE